MVGTAVGAKGQSSNQQSFITEFYDKLNAVIGGDNPNQFLCMTFPGTVISEESFKYNVEQDKPIRVVANESRLANKLFDPVKVTGTDNGRLLTSQYKTALDMLSPRMNLEVMRAKVHLRKLLAEPYSYNFGDGEEQSTLQQVFYRLYDEWVDEKQKWALEQAKRRKLLREIYPKSPKNVTSDEAMLVEANYQEEFLNWYQDNAEPFLAGIEEKQGKILSIFSINDMRIIQGILDSGSGAEIHEARTRLANAEKINPDGGTVYPVTFYPENWHTKLSSSFQYTDLLESEEALTQKIGVLTRQKRNLMSRFENLMAVVPNQGELKNLKEAYERQKDSYYKQFGIQGNTYTGAAASLFNQLATVVSAITGGDEKKAQRKDVVEKTAAGNKETVAQKEDILKSLLNNFETNQSNILKAQSAVDQSITDYLQVAMTYKSTELGTQIMPLVRDLSSQIENVGEQIDSVKQKLSMAVQFKLPAGEKVDVMPNIIDNGYTELLINTNTSDIDSEDSKQTTVTSTKSNGGFWLFGGSSGHETSTSSMTSSLKSSSASVAIGMAVTKVSMTRNWFNPGVFALTADMFKTSETKISEGVNAIQTNQLGNGSGGTQVGSKDWIFPAYPVAFVIAKDVTIRVDKEKSNSDVTATAIEEHVSRGGGFFGFHSSSGSSSSSSSEKSSVQSDSESVTVRFAEPQIIGYYLQVVPEDKSTSIAVKGKESQYMANSGSIIDFVDKIKDVMLGNPVSEVSSAAPVKTVNVVPASPDSGANSESESGTTTGTEPVVSTEPAVAGSSSDSGKTTNPTSGKK